MIRYISLDQSSGEEYLLGPTLCLSNGTTDLFEAMSANRSKSYHILMASSIGKQIGAFHLESIEDSKIRCIFVGTCHLYWSVAGYSDQPHKLLRTKSFSACACSTFRKVCLTDRRTNRRTNNVVLWFLHMYSTLVQGVRLKF